jgi:hypothetical protein
MTQTRFPHPLIDLSGAVVIDSSSNVPIAQNALQGLNSSYGEVNTYTVSGTIAPTSVAFTLIDTIEWDADDNIVYRHVEIDGEPGEFAPDINIQVSIINQEYDDPSDNTVYSEILGLVNEIQCSDLSGLGTLGDYTALLNLARDISGTVDLTMTLSNLQAFADTAQDYGELFVALNQTIAGVTEVDTTNVLITIKSYLMQIKGMFDSIKNLNLTLTRTSTLKIPDTIQDTADLLDGVHNQMACSLNQLEYFCSGEVSQGASANPLSNQNKAMIDNATATLNWFNALVSGNNVTATVDGNTQVANLKSKVDAFSSLQLRLNAAKTCLQDALNATGLIPQ